MLEQQAMAKEEKFKVILSPNPREARAAEMAFPHRPNVRGDKVAGIKRMVKERTYRTDCRKVAGGIIKEAMMLRFLLDPH